MKSMATIVGVLGFIISPIIVVSLSKNNSNRNGVAIIGQGSSSVSPIISALTKDTFYDVQYTANGSGKGLESQYGEKLASDFGMMSSKKYPKKPKEIENWKNHKIRTITFAVDAISIVINTPKGIKYTGSRPLVNIEELSRLYDEDTSDTPTWAELLENELPSSTNLTDKIIPLGRDGGKEASGTSDGFWHTLSKHMKVGAKADLNHEFLSNDLKTPEANAQAMRVLKNKEGAVTYISLGYALLNESNNAKIASIKVGSDIWVPSMENIHLGTYKWTRPFNMAYSTKNVSSINFASFLFSPTTQKIISKESFVPLTIDQIKNQLPLDQTDEERLANFSSGDGFGLEI